MNTQPNAIPSITRTNSSRSAGIQRIIIILGIVVVGLLLFNDAGIRTAQASQVPVNNIEYTSQRALASDPHTTDITPGGERKPALQGTPTRPANMTATPGGSGEMTLSWDDPNDTAITKYQYRHRIWLGGHPWNPDWTDISGSGATTTSHTLSGLTNGDWNVFEIRSLRGEHASPAVQKIAIPRGPLTTATNLTATTSSSRFVLLVWDNADDRTLTSYQYRYLNSSDTDWNPDWTHMRNSASGTTRYGFSNLTNGIEYTFEIRTVRGDDVGPATSINAIPRGHLASPANMTATPGDPGEVKLGWDDPNDITITKYQYRHRLNTTNTWNPDWSDISNSGATTTAHTLTGLTNGANYVFEVRAVRDNRFSPTSRDSAIPQGPLAAPSNLTVDNEGNRSVLLEWDRSSDLSLTSYQYRYLNSSDTDWNPDWTHMRNSAWNTTRYGFNNLTNGIEYTFEIRTVRGDTVGPATSINAIPRGSIARPANMTATPTGGGEILLSWDNPNDITITKYQYRQWKRVESNWNPDWTDIPNSGATTTTHTLTGLTESADYRFEVRAVRGERFGPQGRAETIPLASLAAPSNFSATAGSRQAALTWNNPSNSSIAGYQFRYQVSSTNNWNPDWTDIPSSGATTTSYTVAGLTNGVQYVFEIRATRGGVGSPSSSSTATPTGPLTAPTNLIAAPVGGGQIKLSWDDARDSTITKFQYRYRVNSASTWNPDWTDIPNSGATTTASHTITGLTAGTDYRFEVRAVRNSTNGPASNKTGTPRAALAAPSNLNVAASSRQVALTWDNPNNDSIEGYQFRYRNNSLPIIWEIIWTSIPSSGATTTTLTVGDLTNGVQYLFEVRATRGGLGGPASNGMATPTGSLTAPANLTATPDGIGAVKLSWDELGDITITKYQHRYRVNSASGWNPDWTDVPNSSATTTSHTLTGLTTGTTYRIEVRAVRGTTNGPAANVTTAARNLLERPSNLKGISGDRRVTLTWDRSPDDSVTGYEYQYKQTRAVAWHQNWTTIPGSRQITTSYVIRGLVNETDYTFELRALRGSLQGPAATANATPLGPPTAPGQPPRLNVEQGDEGLALYWHRPPGEDERAPITSYSVRYRRLNTSSWSYVSRNDELSQRETISGLTNRQAYEIQVAAVNRIGTSPWISGQGTPQPPWTPPPGPEGAEPFDVGQLNVWWNGRDANGNQWGNYMEREVCTGAQPFTVIWAGPDDDRRADEWAAHINTSGGAGAVDPYSFSASPDDPEYFEMNGTATMEGSSVFSISVRGRFGSTWGKWSPISSLYCSETSN